MFRNIFLIICIVFLSGCASDPYFNDFVNNPERVELNSQDQSMRISYLSRYLLESDDRAKLESEISNSEYVKSWGAGEYSTLTSMATDIHLGQIGSSSGKALGNSVFIGGVVLGEIFDGQYDQVGQIFLPKDVDGTQLETLEQAEAFVSEMLSKKIKVFAENNGYQVSCILECESLNQIFGLSSEQNTRIGYHYWPADIAISTYVKGLKEAPENHARDAMLGFNAKWQSDYGESLLIYTYGDFYRGDSKEVKIRDRGYKFVGFGKDLNEVKVGRDIRKAIFDNPYMLLGDSDVYPSQIFYDGEIYGFIGTSKRDFVKFRMVEASVE